MAQIIELIYINARNARAYKNINKQSRKYEVLNAELKKIISTYYMVISSFCRQ